MRTGTRKQVAKHCLTLLEDTLVGGALVGLSCRTHLQGHSCRTLLWDILVENSCRTLLYCKTQDTLVISCGTLTRQVSKTSAWYETSFNNEAGSLIKATTSSSPAKQFRSPSPSMPHPPTHQSQCHSNSHFHQTSQAHNPLRLPQKLNFDTSNTESIAPATKSDGMTCSIMPMFQQNLHRTTRRLECFRRVHENHFSCCLSRKHIFEATA